MKNAFEYVFNEGYKKAMIIGSDLPDIKKSVFKKTFEKLSGNDAVLGPCVDGGYYLIGFNKSSFLPDVFSNIEWSKENVFSKTMDVFRSKNKKVFTLEKQDDVDEIGDLKDLIFRSGNSDFENSFTIRFIKKVTQGL